MVEAVDDEEPSADYDHVNVASSRNPPRPRIGRIARWAALLARIGADARDDEELRQKKALLVLLAILILPLSAVWANCGRELVGLAEGKKWQFLDLADP